MYIIIIMLCPSSQTTSKTSKRSSGQAGRAINSAAVSGGGGGGVVAATRNAGAVEPALALLHGAVAAACAPGALPEGPSNLEASGSQGDPNTTTNASMLAIRHVTTLVLIGRGFEVVSLTYSKKARLDDNIGRGPPAGVHACRTAPLRDFSITCRLALAPCQVHDVP